MDHAAAKWRRFLVFASVAHPRHPGFARPKHSRVLHGGEKIYSLSDNVNVKFVRFCLEEESCVERLEWDCFCLLSLLAEYFCVNSNYEANKILSVMFMRKTVPSITPYPTMATNSRQRWVLFEQTCFCRFPEAIGRENLARDQVTTTQEWTQYSWLIPSTC